MPTINVGPGSALELQAIADAMGKSKKVVVVTGAGISTNCGIPDFRSENGLYSLIQAQYDAAVQNPPWESKHNYDIDDRPKKKRRRWFYEVVSVDGTVVATKDEDDEDEEGNKTKETEPTLPNSSTATPSRSKTASPSSSPLSSPPPSSPSDSSSVETTTPPSEQTDDSTVASSQSSRPDLPNLKGRDLFDSMVWKDAFTTSIFYMFISSLREKIQDVTTPTPTHQFLKTLHNGGRLVRNYTQNIDCLEERLGLCSDLSSGPGSKTRFNVKAQRERIQLGSDSNISTGVQIVQLHGSLSKLRCGLCLKLCSWEDGERAATIGSGQAPDCPFCTEYNAKRTGRGRRGLAVGRLRPDIVLYGEEHPHANLVGPLVTHDLALGPDILLILGTSLKVHGLKIIVKEFAKTVHDRGGKVIFVNRTKPPESTWGDVIDYWVGWDCDAWVLDLKERRGDIWLPPGSSQEVPKTRRQSSGNTTSTRKARPQATRDDRQSGVFHTFKILDSLRQLPDSAGNLAARSMYWHDQRRYSGAGLPSKKVMGSVAASTSVSKTKPPTKSKSSSNKKPVPTSKANTANTSKKRKSYPAAIPAESLEYWDKLRELAPSLSAQPSKMILSTGRMPLKELHDNMPQHLKPFSFGFPSINDAYRKTSPNHLPDVPGLEMPSKSMPNLLTHPPSGLTIPMQIPRKLPPATFHTYGTRSSQRWSVGESTVVENTVGEDSIVGSTITVNTQSKRTTSRPSWGSNESTIIVAPIQESTPPDFAHATTPKQGPTPPDSAQASTPDIDSRPMTPGSQRIKRMGSIGAILSSPENGPEVFEDAKESPDVFYDAKSD